jgi:tRNA(His) 5'-end guanylyltransferase
MTKTSLGNRMKENYEYSCQSKLLRRVPVIIRLDGKAFHTFTKNCIKPFDDFLREAMEQTTIKLCKEIQGAKCGYVQSDEISILLTDFDRLNTNAWFDYNIQKIVSISASMTSTKFNAFYNTGSNLALFDSRAFNIPKEETCNYFIWRQQDWIRNSLQMLAREYYSHKELYQKKTSDIHEMLHEKNINWNNIADKWKNGSFIFYHNHDLKWKIRHDIIFTQDRFSIEQFNIPIED